MIGTSIGEDPMMTDTTTDMTDMIDRIDMIDLEGIDRDRTLPKAMITTPIRKIKLEICTLQNLIALNLLTKRLD